MHKKISVGLCLTFCIIAVAIAVSITIPLTLFGVNMQVGTLKNGQTSLKKVNEINSIVRSNFLSTIDDAALNNALADGFMKGLNDNYAQYLDGKEYKDKQDENKGKSFGLGIVVVKHPDNNFFYVVSVAPKSPAEKAGILKGDLITKINEKETVDIPAGEISQYIHGEKDTIIKLLILRAAQAKEISAKLDTYETEAVSYHMIDSIGYIKIITFDDATVGQFNTALKALQDLKATALIFDLRDNGGGTVESCAKILDKLVPSGAVVTVKNKDGKISVTNKSDGSEISLPMAVIMNGGTASASEIFAMNIKDYNKGKLIGTKSYGKGIVQTTFQLSDKTAVKFTTGQIVNKQGKSYHGVGFEPDIKVTLTEEQQKYFFMLQDNEDPQIMAAVTELKK